ncbi:MAG: GspH/FimT family pseudopilin [Candidatus Eisenbacteria bacterium]|nr:GspH/FimT family pseudopilin [Candidatus Eisenbacteria bacterium]
MDGFSLMELMIVLVVAGIIFAIGLPAFGSYRNSLALKQVRTNLLEDLRSARQYAVSRRSPVYVIFGNPPATTNITSYQIYVDKNANGVLDTDERLYRRNLPSTTQLLSVSVSPQPDTLVFDISGILWPGSNGGTLVFANQRGNSDTLQVSAAGIAYRP